nr:hypothetical protein BaRGS_026749 [Batillaria attramentaria]
MANRDLRDHQAIKASGARTERTVKGVDAASKAHRVHPAPGAYLGTNDYHYNTYHYYYHNYNNDNNHTSANSVPTTGWERRYPGLIENQTRVQCTV